MQNKHYTRRSRRDKKKEKRQVKKTIFQTVIAFVLLIAVWSVSVSKQPAVKAFCDKIKHYLTYTVDVKSVFRPFMELNDSGVNENVH